MKELHNRAAAEKEGIQADSLFYQGELLYNSDKPSKALIYYKAAERVARTSAQHDTVITCLLKQTAIHMKMQDSKKSENKAREGLAYARLLRRHDEELQFLLLYARSLRKANKLNEAMTAIFDGIELSGEARKPARESDFVIELAEVSLAKHENKRALDQATSGLRRAILFNDTKRIPILADLVDRIVSSTKKDTESSVSVALRNLPPLKAQYA